MNILYYDRHLLVVSKQQGMLTQPNGTKHPSLQEKAKEFLKKKKQKKGNVFLEPIHRLDYVTSGIVVFAHTSKALSRMTQQIREKKMQKIYLAKLQKRPKTSSNTLVHYLLHKDHKAIVAEGNPKAKRAELLYTTLEETHASSVVRIELFTGRYHQIRIQFASIGCPIVGDRKYGAIPRDDLKGICLHHMQVSLFHPITKEKMTFTDLPNWVGKMSLIH